MTKDEDPDVMKLSGGERVIIGVRMFEEFREQIIASMPKGLPPEEFKRQLVKRIYGREIDEIIKTVRDGPEL